MRNTAMTLAVAIFSVLIASLMKMIVSPILPMDGIPFSFYFAAVMFAAWYGGLNSGLIATIASVIAVWSTFPEVRESFHLSEAHATRSVIFVLQAVFISALAGQLHYVNHKAFRAERDAHRASRDRRITERRFRDLVSAGSIGVCAGTLDGWITEANESALTLLGLSNNRLDTGPINWREMTPPEYFEADSLAVNQVRSNGRCQPYEKEFLRPDGRRIPVLIVATRLDEHPDGFLAFLFDRSMQKKTESELEAAREAFESARQVKLDFLANTSHELRTPMNAIIGMTQLALQEELSPVVRQYLDTSHQAAQDLLTLISDILDFSKIGSGKFTLERQPFSLRETMDRLMKTLSLRAAEKGLELVVDIPSTVPDHLLGDGLRLRQILLNLGGNAVKFTDKGEILIRADATRLVGRRIRLRFAVIDTGIGIPKDAVGRILEPFSQVDSSTTRKHTGVGLGLAIAKELSTLMNGHLWCESVIGKGTTFFAEVEMDLGPGEEMWTTRHDINQLHGLRVLIVDDNETNRRILLEMLASWKMRPTAVESASAAQFALRQALDESDRFQLVLVDALMPEVDGFELIERIRKDGELQDPVVLMLSSADRHLFADRGSRLRMSAFLEKPIAQSDLLDAIMSVVGPTPGKDDEGEADSSIIKPQPLQILLAEDTRVNQLVVQKSLAKRGHEVTLANNGREAIDLWSTGQFDLILMDVQMPLVDGLQATIAIRSIEEAEKRAWKTPIIAMTAHAMHGDQQRCLDSGMDDYISKPVDVQDMVAKIEMLASRRIRARQPDAGDARMLDVENSLRRMGGDRSLLIATAEFFQDDAPGLWNSLNEAIAKGDVKSAERAVHSLKGLAANFGAAPFVNLAEVMEEDAKAKNLKSVQRCLPELEVQLKKLQACLGELISNEQGALAKGLEDHS
jgi:PAS domain S-box-containing protein